MLLSKSENILIEQTTSVANEILTPVMDVLVLPAELMLSGYNYLRSLQKIDIENKNLRADNRRLTIANSQNKALETENHLLSQMLNYAVPPEVEFITAKVVAEEGDAFAHAITVYIGNNSKITKGQVVIGDKGIVGRVEKVGRNYAKIFLINDINSKIPVMIEKSRVRGILSGENSLLPKMIFIPLETEIIEGDIVVTSGIGGIFPSGMRVGEVVSSGKGAVQVKPFNDLNRLEYVQIVNYPMPDLEELNQ